MAAKNVILRKKISNVLYDIMPKSLFSNIFNDDGETLAAVVEALTADIAAKATNEQFTALETRFNNLITDAPEAYDTLKEIGSYISTHKDEYEALLAVAGNKVDKEDGKGLSTNDFTDELLEKLNALYTKAQLDEKFATVQTAVDANTQAVATLNADENTAGSVKKQIKDAIATSEAATKVTTDALTKRVSTNETNIQANTDAIAAINNETTGILAQSKTYTDTTKNALQEAIDNINQELGEITGKGESGGILDSAKSYTDTQVATKGAVYASSTEPENLGELDLWVYYEP